MMRIRARVELPGGASEVREVEGEAVRLGRNPACEVALDPVAFPKVSGLHARVEATAEGFALVHLSRSNRTLRNDIPVDRATPLAAGDRVRLGFTGPTVEILAIGPSPATRPHAPDFAATVPADASGFVPLPPSGRGVRLEVGDGGVIGRDPAAALFRLDHPHISRRHARLAVAGGRVVLADLASANGTFVNGLRLERPMALAPGDRVVIGPYSLEFDGARLVGGSRSDNVELVARDLRRTVRDRATGEDLVLLDDVGLVARPGELVALIGPSGSGKSTLLAILGGRDRPDAGSVEVNGEDLHAHFEALKGDIAVVPQRDALHDALGVGAALRYTAELRLPPDLSGEEVDAAVAEALEVVGLGHRRATPIRHLSGGQARRASLADELVSRPSLLLLDEAISGLDEQADGEAMGLFRRVAEGGKTVVCVTHNLAHVEATCHLVAVLAEGGRLAFVGPPAEALAYFGVGRLGEVYRRLVEGDPAGWRDRFRASPHFRRYVAGRMSAREAEAAQGVETPARPIRRGAGSLRQAAILTRRYLAIWRGDRQALVQNQGTSCLRRSSRSHP